MSKFIELWIWGVLGLLGSLGLVGEKKPVITETVINPRVVFNPQYVIFSFDGSWSLSMWNKTLDFAKTAGFPIKYTYFISGVYLLPVEDRFSYQAPGQNKGESKIGFASNPEDVRQRVALINQATSDGHEIGSHLNGHFSGEHWTNSDWESEFKTFNRLVGQAPGINIKSKDVIGFRAPNLAINKNLWPVMVNFGYKYEAGGTGKSDQWPKMENEVLRFILPAIRISGTKNYALAMDYNFFTVQTGGKDILKRDTSQWKNALSQTVKSWMDYFKGNYLGNRAPVVFAVHFSEWNEGLYWEAMKSFAKEVCIMEDVKCGTYAETTEYIVKNKL